MQRHIHTNHIQKKPNQVNSAHSPITDKIFAALKEKAFARRPMLRHILDVYGDMSLLDFAKSYNRTNEKIIPEERKVQFVNTFVNEVERLLGSEVAETCKKQLDSIYRVITTDHHGPISEPGMVNGNIHKALPYLSGDPLVKNIIVLGCANVSFDNESFPRGLLFHSYQNNEALRNQIVFYPRAVRPCPVVYYSSYTDENLENAKKRIVSWVNEGIITETRKNELEQLLANIYTHPSVLSCTLFSEQITKTNYMLWKQIMKDYPKAPNLIYIEQENIVNKLLLNYHLDQKTMIHKLLFTPKYHKLIKKYFDGILCGFSEEKKTGTYLFWALPKGQKYRVQLWKKGNVLETEDGSYKIELTPEGIRNAIINKELIPSTLMSFILLAFYYGVRLIGGSNQTTYLTQMKEAFMNMQNEAGDLESHEFARDVSTTDLSIAIESLAFIQTPQGTQVPATGIDLVLYSNKSTLKIMKQIAKELTVKETFFRALPDCYRWYYKEEERDPKLSQITKEDMEKYLQIEHKIVSSAKIS